MAGPHDAQLALVQIAEGERKICGTYGYVNVRGGVVVCVKINWKGNPLYYMLLDTVTVATPIWAQLCGKALLAEDKYVVYGTDRVELDYKALFGAGLDWGRQDKSGS